MKSRPQLNLVAAAFVTVLVVLGALSPAQAADKKPNILVIWGDDIGYWNPSAYHRGMMGYQTPNIDSIANQGGLFTDWYGQQSCTAGRAAFITGPVADPHRSHQGWVAGGRSRAQDGRPDDRRAAQAARLHDRPVRQEPPRRPRGALADRAWLRRVLRQSLSPQRRGGAGERGLSEGPGVQEKVRSAWSASSASDRPTAQIEDTGPLTKKRMETIDDEITAAALDFMDRRQGRTNPSSFGGIPPACTFGPISRRRPRARPAWAFIPTAWSSTMGTSANC